LPDVSSVSLLIALLAFAVLISADAGVPNSKPSIPPSTRQILNRAPDTLGWICITASSWEPQELEALGGNLVGWAG